MSTTALAEYCDMLFTRLCLQMGNRHWRWWLEINPDDMYATTDVRAYVTVKALVPSPSADPIKQGQLEIISYRARMNAIEANAEVPLHIKENVVDYHVKKFMALVEECEEIGKLGTM